MSRGYHFSKGLFGVLVFALCFAAGPLPAIAANVEGDGALCRRAAVLALDDTLRVTPLPGSEPLFLRLEVFEPGTLHLAARADRLASAEPVLTSLAVSCDGVDAPTAPVLLARTRASLLLAIERPGSYIFRLSASPLPDLTIRSAFLPASWVPGISPNSISPSKAGENEDEIELEPDPAPFQGDPLKAGENPDEIELEPDPFAQPGLESALEALCAAAATDDHGDTFACATPVTLERSVDGEIANAWGDDVDVFRFVLPGDPATALWAVEVSTAGPAETVAVLFDRGGRRLAGNEGGNGLREVLRPGVYYLQLAGALGTEGRYRLTVGASGL